MQGVQIFGVRNSQATRAAERFFKERNVPIHYVDLRIRPISAGEIKRFVAKFGLTAILDTEGKPYEDAGLKYLKVSESDLLARVEKEPRLLRLPLVRAGNLISIGHDENTWNTMAKPPARAT